MKNSKKLVVLDTPEALRLFDEAPEGDTKGKILEAAFRQLVSGGYASLSIREIAKDAGVNHALINYHFHTKEQLVVEVLDAANRRLLERQRRMYETPGGLAEKWEQARRFYDHDLASGFVRLQAELWAASFSNPGLREKFVPRAEAWKKVVLGGVRDAFRTLADAGVKLPPPFTAEALGTWVAEFWVGMEFSNLLGTTPQDRPHREALDAMDHLLKYVDGLARKKARAPARAEKRRASNGRRDP